MEEKNKKQSFWQDERGVGVIEIVLILVDIFRDKKVMFYADGNRGLGW